MSSRASGPDRQPIQRRAPRNVSSASTSPGRVHSATPVRARTVRSTSLRLGAARTTAVANADGPGAPHRSAVREAAATARTSRSRASSGTGSPGRTCSDSRSRHFSVCTGNGTPPAASATTSRTVFDPTSSTLILMDREYPGVNLGVRHRGHGEPLQGREGIRAASRRPCGSRPPRCAPPRCRGCGRASPSGREP